MVPTFLEAVEPVEPDWYVAAFVESVSMEEEARAVVAAREERSKRATGDRRSRSLMVPGGWPRGG